MAASFYNHITSAAHSALTMSGVISADISDTITWAISRAGGYTTAAVRAAQEHDLTASVTFMKCVTFPSKAVSGASLTVGLKADEGTAATVTVTNVTPSNSSMRLSNSIMEQTQEFVHTGTSAISVAVA